MVGSKQLNAVIGLTKRNNLKLHIFAWNKLVDGEHSLSMLFNDSAIAFGIF